MDDPDMCNGSSSVNLTSQQDIDAFVDNMQQCGTLFDSFYIVSPTSDLVFPDEFSADTISVTGLQGPLTLDLNATQSVDDLYMEDFRAGTLILPTVPSAAATTRSAPPRVLEVTLASTSEETVVETRGRVDVYGNGTRYWNQSNPAIEVTMHDMLTLTSLQVQNSNIISPELRLIQDLALDFSVLFTDFDHYIHDELEHGWWPVELVGGSFAIQDWSSGTVRLPLATSVGKQLSIRDCINSAFVLPALISVGSLIMENNGESILPGDFRNLQFADSIELRGKIDTSGSGNIFPSLKLVKQSITIEASNSDFNCSHLAFQQSQGLIGQLNCKVPGGGNGSNTDPESSARRNGVSRGIWLGASVGIAIALLSNL
ncbi:hypothetical protein GGS20DRAFT_421760 [Poronia punctata]|nr:hypothetical protein GGS20DRAFT_421760 [Poronia punctata]